MKTLLNTKIPEDTKGLVYICKYDREKETLTVIKCLRFKEGFDALNAYANIPNPESEMAQGKTHEEFLIELKKLHARMSNKEYLKNLKDYL